MSTARVIVVLAIVIAALAWTSTATSTASTAPSLADGTYLGDVHTLHGLEGVVAVDVVGIEPEVLVAAGDLADLDLLDRTPRPFRIMVREGVIVSLQTADDVLFAA